MSGIYLYTEELFFTAKAKNFVKKISGRNFGGPRSVFQSLNRGLKQLGVEFVVNSKLSNPIQLACVLSGVKTLRWALEQKHRGAIKKIVAGPNIVVTPQDSAGLILDPAIDQYVIPSQQTVEWWKTFNPEFGNKLKVWPAGVEDFGERRNTHGLCLIYKKNPSGEMFKSVINSLKSRNVPYYVVEYGKYKHEDYLANLAKTKFAVFLSESESQGIALHEAWMANIPTLIWNRGFFEYQGKRWEYPLIAAPFFTEDCGLLFKEESDFASVLNEFLNRYNQFSPRAYSLKNFTDSAAAKKYLEIITPFL